MWVAIIGPSGSGKTLISKTLQMLDFELVGKENKLGMKDMFDVDREASYKMHDHNIFTINSSWDYHECLVPFYHKIYQLNQDEKINADKFYSETKNILNPPNFIVYTKITKQFAHDRLVMTQSGEQLIQNIQIQLDLYDDFITRVNVPIIELDMMDAERVVANLKFGIDSVKSLNHARDGIWRREMIRE